MTVELKTTCPQCQSETAAAHAICPRCGASLLLDVVLEKPVTDPKLRFALAKELSTLPAIRAPFSELQAALQSLRPVLAKRVTKVVADQIQGRLASKGVTGTFVENAIVPEPSKTASSGPRGGRWRLPVAIASVLLIAGGAIVTRLPRAKRLLSRIQAAVADAPEEAPSTAANPELMQRAVESTVAIRCNQSVGAGFFIESDKVLTNAHVVCPRGELMKVQLPDGRTVMGTALGVDERLDLAVVRVSGTSQDPLPIRDAATVKAGEAVAIVGSPKGLEFTLSKGTVGYVGRNRFGVGYLQLDVNVNPGNSGGPVVDQRGRVIGVVSMMVKDANGLGLAVPINYAFFGDRALLENAALRDSPGWADFIARIVQSDEREIDETRSSFSRPGLVGAAYRSDGKMFAVVMQRFSGRPSFAPMSFSVEKSGHEVCRPGQASPQAWQEVHRVPPNSGLDPQLLKWLRHHNLMEKLHVAVVELARCRPDELPGAELVLDDAEASAKRAQLEATRAGLRLAP